jgi:hypothetical protein
LTILVVAPEAVILIMNVAGLSMETKLCGRAVSAWAIPPEARKQGSGARVAAATITEAASDGMSFFRLKRFMDLSP